MNTDNVPFLKTYSIFTLTLLDPSDQRSDLCRINVYAFKNLEFVFSWVCPF